MLVIRVFKYLVFLYGPLGVLLCLCGLCAKRDLFLILVFCLSRTGSLFVVSLYFGVISQLSIVAELLLVVVSPSVTVKIYSLAI